MAAILMAGGGTGGHVFPALAVARELERRGHAPFFIGTRQGLEARLVPAGGYPIEFIEIGGLKRVGARRAARTLVQLPLAVWRSLRILGRRRPAACFSLGGYVAGPSTLAARARGLPIVLLEPNAMPGVANRWIGRFAARALVTFAEAAAYFPSGRTTLTGLPVREEFFQLPPKPREDALGVLVTGGSRGSRTLNLAARACWPLLAARGPRVRWIHQSGEEDYVEMARAFAASGLDGRVVAFLDDMPRAFAAADLVVSRAGAGAVAELAAAGKPSLLVPFPFAADDHQSRNAEAMVRAGAARLAPDRELTGERLAGEIAGLADEPGALKRMGQAARSLARPGAAQTIADAVEQAAGVARPLTGGPCSRNNTV